MKNSIYFAILALVLSAVFIILYPRDENIIEREVIIYDTVIKEIRHKPILIKAKPKIIYKSDTVILTKSFTARIDTVILRDTVHAKYDFPENMFTFQVLRVNDTIYIPGETIIKYQKPSWMEHLKYAAGGLAVGFMAGKIR